ncbi:hypothetical protein, partial [Escherichia coli]|uniref:hypothetical protein n=1 Tax=Escherichia coli TaxID=562 RepID=UPI0028DE5012
MKPLVNGENGAIFSRLSVRLLARRIALRNPSDRFSPADRIASQPHRDVDRRRPIGRGLRI